MNLCQTVKKQFPNELELIRRRTNGTNHEHGFGVCLNGASEIVEGNSQSVLIPGCKGPSLGMIHSHQHSPEMERKFGSIVRLYTGHPSALDLRPHPTLRYGCVVSDNLLVCHGKPRTEKRAIQRLKQAEAESNIAFSAWNQGELTDAGFRKIIRNTVKAQREAMRSTGSYCVAKI